MAKLDRSEDDSTEPVPRRILSPAAQRALAEAEERRRLAECSLSPKPKEIGGRDGLDPARYGDWEVKGIISDF
jgi:hypothetical protein